MSKIHFDFLGPFVDFNGQINRPSFSTKLDLCQKLKTKIIKYTDQIKVLDHLGREEIWFACGSSKAYYEAKNTLNNSEFEYFATFGCGVNFLQIPESCKLYQLKKVFKKNIFDYKDENVIKYFEQTKTLEKSSQEKYLKNHSLNSSVNNVKELKVKLKK